MCSVPCLILIETTILTEQIDKSRVNIYILTQYLSTTPSTSFDQYRQATLALRNYLLPLPTCTRLQMKSLFFMGFFVLASDPVRLQMLGYWVMRNGPQENARMQHINLLDLLRILLLLLVNKQA